MISRRARTIITAGILVCSVVVGGAASVMLKRYQALRALMSCCASVGMRHEEGVLTKWLPRGDDGGGPAILDALRSVSEISCAFPNCSDVASMISCFAEVEHLTLIGCHLTSADIEVVSSLSSLRYLNIAQNDLSDADVVVLSRLKGLEELNLSHNEITGSCFNPAEWDALSALKELDVSSSQLNWDGFKACSRFRSLQVFSIKGCRLVGRSQSLRIGAEAVSRVIFPSLEFLDADADFAGDRTALRQFAVSQPSLVRIAGHSVSDLRDE